MGGFKAAALSVIRRGPRQVLWTPPKVHLGNHLYYWLHAFHQQRQGTDMRVLVSDEMRPWSGAFPRVFNELTVDPGDLGLTDQRIAPGARQRFGIDFTDETLDAFIERHLLAADTELTRGIEARSAPSDLTINVRRGDYYSDPRWRGEYSFDVVEFVRAAIGAVQQDSPIRGIHVVSDGLDWCRTKLAWLEEIAPVSYPEAADGPLDHLVALAGSPRLVLANSSFSYWGGYLSAYRARTAPTGIPTGVWAPAFNSRSLPNGRATQLDPRWHIIESIPGGWDG